MEKNTIQKYGIFLNFILSLLSFIIPKNQKQILIGSWDGDMFFGNPKYFFLYLNKEKNKECKVIWITSNRKIYSELKEKKFPVLHLYSLRGFFTILRSKYLIFDKSVRGVSYYFYLLGNFNKIQTWHGLAIKKIGRPTSVKNPIFKHFAQYLLVKERKSYHTIITCSETTKKIDSLAFENKNVRILGYPRNDVFFDKSMIYNDYGKKLNLSKYDKVILYCPTFRENTTSQIPFSRNFLERLNNFLTSNNYIFLDKRHVAEQNIQDFPNLSNIKNVTNEIEDIQDLLVYVDIIITDYSSIPLDFCLTNMPIIFYPYDYEEYLKQRGVGLDYFKELPGPFVRNENELLSCLENINNIFSEKIFKEKFQKFYKIYHYHLDGKSSERLFNYLMNK